MTRPSHGGHAVGVRGLQDGRRVSREAAIGQSGSDPPAPLAAPNNTSYPELIPLLASAQSPPAGAPESEIIVVTIHVCRQSMRGLDRCGTERRRFFSPANRGQLGSKIVPEFYDLGVMVR